VREVRRPQLDEADRVVLESNRPERTTTRVRREPRSAADAVEGRAPGAELAPVADGRFGWYPTPLPGADLIGIACEVRDASVYRHEWTVDDNPRRS